MKCLKCGTEIEKGDLFCPECGKKIKQKERPKKKKTLFVIFGVIIIMGLIAWVIYYENQPRCGNNKCEIENNENKCTCQQDCGICSGSAGICEEYYCFSKNVCLTKTLDNCCGNEVCESGESFETCSSDCKIPTTGRISGYEGPTIFTTGPCTPGPCAGGCCGNDNEGFYLAFGGGYDLLLKYVLPSYDLNQKEGKASFHFYAKPPSRVYSGIFINLRVNGQQVGSTELGIPDWESSSYGFKWYKISFPVSYLKNGDNTFELSGSDWFAVAIFGEDNNYMTYLTWELV